MFLVKKLLLILCLFSAMIAQIATLEVSDETSYIFPDYIGDTIVVPINVELNQIDLYAAEIHLSSFQNNIEFEEVIFEGSLTGDNNWSYVINEQEQVLIIGMYGSQVINQDGSLLALKFSVPDDLEETLFSIQVSHVEFNELSGAIDVANGEVSINHLHFGDVTQNNDVSIMDAAEILRYLVGDVDLNNYQQVAADVTLDQSISALDASVIAQYAIGLIDTFSFLGNIDGTGELSVSNNLEYLPGEILEIPIILNSGDNFLSFEFEVSYDADQLIYNDIEWSQSSTSFMLEQKFESGSIRLVGSSTTPVDVLGILAIIKMQVSQSADEDYIDLVIEKMRINESEPVFDVIVSVTQEALSNDIVSVPSQYELLIAEPGYCSTEGCMDSNFLEFDPFAVADNGSCQTPVVFGCMYNEAANFNPAANVDDGSCSMIVDENCPEDLDGDGSVNTSDLLVLLSTFSAICP